MSGDVPQRAPAGGHDQRFLMARESGSDDSSTSTVLVQNFFEELKRLVPN